MARVFREESAELPYHHRLPALFLTALTASAHAKVVYVDQNAAGAVHNGASWSSAYLTITNAVSSAASGDEVWVAKGTYLEQLTPPAGVSLYGGFVGTESQRTQRDWRGNVTVVDGGTVPDSIAFDCRAPNILVDGFTARAHYDIVAENNGTATISHCDLSGSPDYCVLAGTATLTLSNNVIRDCRNEAVNLTDVTATLVNNVIYGSQSDGVVVDHGTATLVGNTIVGSGNDGVLFINSTATLKNNIIAFSRYFAVATSADATGIAYSHNDAFGNPSGVASGFTPQTGQGNISEDPLFVDEAGGDYHLSAGSTAIDAGDDSVVTSGSTDLDGKPRILGSHVDIGAYEFGAPVQPFTTSDVIKALRLTGGLLPAGSDDMSRLNAEPASPAITIADAVLIARKVAGL